MHGSALDEFVEDAYVVALDHDLGPFGQSQLETIAEHYLIASQDLEDQGLICTTFSVSHWKINQTNRWHYCLTR